MTKTKAELINEIKNRIGFDTDNETYAMSKDERDFYTSILKILEQEPCEDAVSRQVVKERMLKYGFHAPDMTVTEFVEDLPSVIPKHEGNTVSEEVYTEEYLQRKRLECELYLLKRKISELI